MDNEAPKTDNRARFELELEFVQSLANPYYLNSLAQQSILEQPAFVHYLEYLQYWREKDYARFIHYPQALHHLELLQHESFRDSLKKDQWLTEILQQKQYEHWRTWRDPSKIVDGEEALKAAAANPGGNADSVDAKPSVP